jgi:hypothetical protein
VFRNTVLSRIFESKNMGVEKTTNEGALWFVSLNKYNSGDQNQACNGIGLLFTLISIIIGPSGISFRVFGKLGTNVPEGPDARTLLILQ